MRKIFLIAMVLFFSSTIETGAQCLGSCCSTESNTCTSYQSKTESKGEWQFSTGFASMVFEPFSNDELKQFSTIDNATFTVKSQQLLRMGLRYNLTNRIQLSAVLPYNFSVDNREGHTHSNNITGIHDYGNVSGFGDATFIFGYVWLKKNSSWNFSTGLGIKTPTGETKAVSSNNVVVPQHLQPGSGSWDPVVNVKGSKKLESFTIGAELFGKISTTANSHNMGNYVSGNAYLVWQCFELPDNFISSVQLTTAMQTDYSTKIKMPSDHLHTGDDAIEIAEFENSGFTRVFLSGGALIALGSHITLPFNFSLPVYQHLNGYQVKLLWKGTVGLNFNF